MNVIVSESAQLLICPLDQTPLCKVDKSFKCQHNHQFDIARQGYVNLLPVQNKRSKSPGDTKQMVQARRDFLTTGAYQPVSDTLNQLVAEHTQAESLNILDAGCGEGYYLNRLNQTLNSHSTQVNAFGLDIAKFAIQAAAKTDKLSTYLVASNRSIPLSDQSLDLIYCAFGFPVFEEFAAKLKKNGKLILIESGPEHLIELRQMIYPSIKPYQQNPYPQAGSAGFNWQSQSNIQYKVNLQQAELANLLLMTPHIHKASPDKKQQLAALTELELTVDVNYRILALS